MPSWTRFNQIGCQRHSNQGCWSAYSPRLAMYNCSKMPYFAEVCPFSFMKKVPWKCCAPPSIKMLSMALRLPLVSNFSSNVGFKHFSVEVWSFTMVPWFDVLTVLHQGNLGISAQKVKQFKVKTHEICITDWLNMKDTLSANPRNALCP